MRIAREQHALSQLGGRVQVEWWEGAHAAKIWKTAATMAKKRPTPAELPDAVREAVDRTVQATVGSAQLTRERAQEAVDEVVRSAETRAGAVRQAVRGALEDRRPATQEDLRDLTREVRSISRRLTAIEERLPSAPAAPPARGAGGGKTRRAGKAAPAKRSK